MGHSLRPDNLTITPDFVISDGTQNSGYVLVSNDSGIASWKDPSNLAGFKTNHYVGELWGGGIVASVWKENDIEKCLIASLSDYGYTLYDYDLDINWPYSNHQWSNIRATGSATSSFDGLSNSNSIIAQVGHISSAASFCLGYTNPDFNTGTFSDWYLPSITEMQQLVNNSFKLNFSVKKYADDNSKAIDSYYPDSTSNSYVDLISRYSGSYWTSTEVMNSGGLKAYSIYIDNSISQSTKSSAFSVRPVRIASDTTIITKYSHNRTPSTGNYNIQLISQINGFGDSIVEIGTCWNGTFSVSSGYGIGPDKLVPPLPTISDNKIVATMIYNSNIGFGYGIFQPDFSQITFNDAYKYSIRSYAKTNKGDIKYGEQFVL